MTAFGKNVLYENEPKSASELANPILSSESGPEWSTSLRLDACLETFRRMPILQVPSVPSGNLACLGLVGPAFSARVVAARISSDQ